MPDMKNKNLIPPALSTAPDFLKQGMDMGKVKRTLDDDPTMDPHTVAAVGADDPYNIHVYHPDVYTPAIQTHELVHTWQDTRNKGVQFPNANKKSYDYGGREGLEKDRLSGKTIANYGPEQQAQIVREYQSQHNYYLNIAKNGKMTPQDAKDFSSMKQTYEPFMRQIAAYPGPNDSMTSIDTRVRPPGIPSPEISGIVQPDPLIGGELQRYKPQQKFANKLPPMPGQESHPAALLQTVLTENKGFGGRYTRENTSVAMADTKRAALNKKYGGGGGLEWWPPEETGTKEFPRPVGTEGKTVLEIFDPTLQRNPERLKGAIYGDLLHGMDNDPKFGQFKQEFIANYKPDIATFNQKIIKERGLTPKSVDDMYIRGLLSPDEKNGEFQQNKAQRYTPKQLQIIEKMRNYIATGK